MSQFYPSDEQDAVSITDGPNYWDSTDIWLNGTSAGPAKPPVSPTTAYSDTKNLFVTVRKNNNTFNESLVRVDAFVSGPSLILKPNAMKPLASNPITFTKDKLDGGFFVQQFPWPPQGQGGPPDAGAPGTHCCVVARAYPYSGEPLPVPTQQDFHIAQDQHEAQCNIQIVTTQMPTSQLGFAGAGARGVGTSDGEAVGPGKDGLWEFRIDTMLPTVARDAKPAPVRIIAGAPDAMAFLKALPEKRRPCKQFDGFAKPSKRFLMDFDLPDEDLPPDPRGGKRPFRPKVGQTTFDERRLRRQVDVELAPDRIARFAFKADLSETPVGQAQLFTLEQTDRSGQPQGGLTVIFYRVE